MSGRGREPIDANRSCGAALRGKMSRGMGSCSARRSLDMSVSTVHKRLRNILHYHPFKITSFQELHPADLLVQQIPRISC